MTTKPEDDLIDQSLRDAFRDYHLPPAGHMHVWAGVEERIAALPMASRGLSYRLIIPLTAVLGVAVGWLLPHPAVQKSPPPPAPVVRTAARVASEPAAVSGTRSLIPTQPAGRVDAATTVASTAPVATQKLPIRAAQKRTVAATRSYDRPATTVVTTASPEDNSPNLMPQLPAASTVSEPAAAEADKLPVATFPQPTQPDTNVSSQPSTDQVVAPTAKSSAKSKEEGDERILYHKPTHRQPERKSGIHQWFSRLTQGLRQLL